MVLNYYLGSTDENRVLSLKLDRPYSLDKNLFDQMMENVFVTFSMYSEKDNNLVIANKEGYVSYDGYGNYLINYKFNNINLKKGKYLGQFSLVFNGVYCGTLNIPISRDLQIFVEQTTVKSEIVNIYDIPESLCDFVLNNFLSTIYNISLKDIENCGLINVNICDYISENTLDQFLNVSLSDINDCLFSGSTNLCNFISLNTIDNSLNIALSLINECSLNNDIM